MSKHFNCNLTEMCEPAWLRLHHLKANILNFLELHLSRLKILKIVYSVRGFVPVLLHYLQNSRKVELYSYFHKYSLKQCIQLS